MIDFQLALGLNVRAARRAARLRQSELARQIGVARTTLVAIEQGQRKLRQWELTKIAEILAIPVEDLVPSVSPPTGNLLIKGHYAFLSDDEFDLINAYRDNNLRRAMELLLKSG